jgi:SAM-dependent methyltransferase
LPGVPGANPDSGGRYAEDLAHIHAEGFTALGAIAGPAIVALLRDAGIEGGLVVDLGCGSGVTSRVLVDAGYRVLGIDTSRPLLARARKEAPGAQFRHASFLDEAISGCAAVIAVGEVLNYTERSLRPVFQRVRAALHPGGLFVLDSRGPAVCPATGRCGAGRRARTGRSWSRGGRIGRAGYSRAA